MDNDKITINGKGFYVIPECKKEGYTLCAAAEPWCESKWGEGANGQKILDAADNRNPESLTSYWYKTLPDDIKKAMLTVRVTTGDYNEAGEGVLEQTEMFVPSYEEWTKVPQEIRKMIAKDDCLWSRSYYDTILGSISVWGVNPDGYVYNSFSQNYPCTVAPAFYLEDSLLGSLLSEKKASPRKMLL